MSFLHGHSDLFFLVRQRGKTLGNLWEIVENFFVKSTQTPEEGSEPGALCGCDAVCHGHGRRAAFSDQDKIKNTEAVDACVALNIIGGYEDGSYHPERNIKRSEITKMICVALNGGKEPNVSTNTTPTFSATQIIFVISERLMLRSG